MRLRPDAGIPAALLAVLAGCASETVDGAEGATESAALVPTEVVGSCADAFGADMCTWTTTDADRVVEAGATLSLASVENAPADAEMAWPPVPDAVASFPKEATAAGGFDHMTFLWEPIGHTPPTFQIPHFDFHFYLVPDAERRAIQCDDHTKPEAPPAGYIMPDETLPPEMAEMIGVETLVGLCVPQMGMHAANAEQAGSPDPFEATMIIGYYRGEPIFIEPMVAQTRLMQRRSFELPIPAIAGLEGRQPTTFRAEYVEADDAYRFTFAGYEASQ